jgi:hypothetical protein
MLEMVEEEEKSAIEEACQHYDEQEEILKITMREIAQQEMKQPSMSSLGPAASYYSPVTKTKDYHTGNFPTLAEVQKENRFSSYSHNSHNPNSQYGTWDRDGYRKNNGIATDDRDQPWKNRFDDDDGVCRDPYAYYSGDWY